MKERFASRHKRYNLFGDKSSSYLSHPPTISIYQFFVQVAEFYISLTEYLSVKFELHFQIPQIYMG